MRRVTSIAFVAVFVFASISSAQYGLNTHTTYASDKFLAPPENRVSTLSTHQVDPSKVRIAPTSGAGLTITPTFDASITGNGNAVAIENAINAAISVMQARFRDPINVQIYFRFASTDPTNGAALSVGTLGQSYHFHYFNYTWANYVADLNADKKTSYDTTALANMPGSSLNASANIEVGSANGRAVGETAMTAAMSPTGVLGCGGTAPSGCVYDGIITLNSGATWSFTRPTPGGAFDAQRTVEHEMDEVLGLGSFIGNGTSTNCPTVACYNPQDIWSYSGVGTRSILTTGSRYFSINNGTTNLVGFNQTSGGDFGDWLSGSCPQSSPLVQNAFACAGQSSDVTATSPEAINLDVIGYDLVTSVAKADFNGDSKSDIAIWHPATGQWWVTTMQAPVTWGSNGDVIVPGDYNGDGKAEIGIWHPTDGTWWITSKAAPVTWGANGDIPIPADYDGDGKTDIAIWHPATGQWWITSKPAPVTWGASGDVLVPGDYDGDGKTDIAIWHPATGQWWITTKAAPVTWGASGDTPVPADYDGDGKTDIAIWHPTDGSWWIQGFPAPVFWGQAGDIPVPADYDGDGKADIAIFRPSTGQWWIRGAASVTVWGGNGDVVPTQAPHP